MRNRPSITIAVVTAAQLLRADFDGRGRSMTALRQSPRNPGTRAADAVRAALALGGRPALRVLVLCEDLWSQSVSLPAAQTDGLTPHETAQALGFEIEPFSNVSPVDGAVGFCATRRAAATNLFWVVQCRHGELAAMRDAVAEAGGRLTAVSHPGGLPAPIGEADPLRPWYRVEHWTRGIITVRAAGGPAGPPAVESITPAQLRADLPASAEHVEVLADVGGDAPAGLPGSVPQVRLALGEEAVARRWLQAWARCLDEAPAGLALVQAPPSVTPAYRYALAGAAIVALLATFCLGHWHWSSARRQTLRAELAAARDEAGQIARLDVANAAARREIQRRQQEQRDGEEFGRVLAQRRRAMPALLHGLAAATPGDVVIQGLRDEGNGRMLIRGMGMTAGSADELATQLADQLRGTGWSVQPLQRTAQGLLADAGPWRFLLRMTLAGMPPAAARPVNDGESP